MTFSAWSASNSLDLLVRTVLYDENVFMIHIECGFSVNFFGLVHLSYLSSIGGMPAPRYRGEGRQREMDFL